MSLDKSEIVYLTCKLDDYRNILEFATKAQYNIVKAGQTGSLLLNEDMLAFVGMYRQIPVSIIVYYHDKDKQYWINIFYVEEKYRQQGLFKDLMNEFIHVCKQNHIRKIQEGTKFDNVVAIKALEKAKFKPLFTVYELEV